jgi:hypothetical protein
MVVVIWIRITLEGGLSISSIHRNSVRAVARGMLTRNYPGSGLFPARDLYLPIQLPGPDASLGFVYNAVKNALCIRHVCLRLNVKTLTASQILVFDMGDIPLKVV